MAEADLSKIVSLIMENPKIIEEINGLTRATEEAEEASGVESESTPPEINTVTDTYTKESPGRARRRDLFLALKPYVSEGRSRAIESMMSIADILDMMRTK